MSNDVIPTKISTRNPCCIALLVDQSDSMQHPCDFGDTKPKCEALAEVVNEFIQSLLLVSQKEDGTIANRFEVAVIGYGEETRPLVEDVSGIIVPLTALADEVRFKEDDTPFWIEPKHGGRTPTAEALSLLEKPLSDWVDRHPGAHPPIICNVTDGLWTDVDPFPILDRILELKTNAGNVLFFCAAFGKGRVLRFPSSLPEDFEKDQRDFFEHSSILPSDMKQLAEETWNCQLEPDARCFILNAAVRDICDMFMIGSKTTPGAVRG